MFILNGLQVNRGIFNAQVSGGNSKTAIHTYKNTADSIATITGASYFPVFFGVEAGLIQIGDVIKITASDGVADTQVTGVSPTAVIAITPDNIFPSGIVTQSVNALTPGSLMTVGANATLLDIRATSTLNLGATTTGTVNVGGSTTFVNVGQNATFLNLGTNANLTTIGRPGATIVSNGGILFANNGGGTFSDFNSFGPQSVTWQGSALSSGSVGGTISGVRINGTKWISCAGIGQQSFSGSPSSISCSAGSIPSGFEPSQNTAAILMVAIDSSTEIVGHCEITTSGEIFIGPGAASGANFTNGNIGFNAFFAIYS